MKTILKNACLSLIMSMVACTNTQQSSAVKEETAKKDLIAEAVAKCKTSVTKKVYHEADYGTLEYATFEVITTSTNDLGKPDPYSILAEIDFNDSESSRWIVDFNGQSCKVNSADEFTLERWNTEMTPALQASTDSAMKQCKPALVKELQKKFDEQGIDREINEEDVLLKMLRYSTETAEADLILAEVDFNDSELDRWVASFEVRNCKVAWMNYFSVER